MKCYFARDPKTGRKFLIPFCYGSLHRDDKSHCTCADYPTTDAQYERASFNERVTELNKVIKDQQESNALLLKETNYLNRIIDRLTKPKRCQKNKKT